jgi:hypothetical protein
MKAQMNDGARVFADPVTHRLITSRIFTACLTSPVPEAMAALTFWRAYRHLAEGGETLALPFHLSDKDAVIRDIDRVVRGNAPTSRLDQMETDDDQED